MVRSRRVVARVIGALSALVMLAWIVSLLGVVAWAHRDGARTADAIVVLGAAQYVGRPSPVLRARLDHAITLWKRRLAPRLIVTGGTGLGDTTSEAAVGRKYAIRRGVPDSAIVIEPLGRTTRESMRAVAAYMHTQSTTHTRVILVSDPFHMFRLAVLARRHGMTPYTSPTHTSPISAKPSEELKYVLSESVKVPWAYLFERRAE
jgi:uncharacterized SAM-binding protein YcdF (DUF218 family)